MRLELLESAQKQAEVCGVFGNPYRVLIVWALGKQERSVTDIAAAIECSLQNTSQHLRLMRDKGILNSRRDGNTIYYRVNDVGPLAHCDLFQLSEDGILVEN